MVTTKAQHYEVRLCQKLGQKYKVK